MPGNPELWSIVRRSAKTLVLQTVVISAIVGGTTAFVSLEKTVTLSVDGVKQVRHTFAGTVQDLLRREGITTSERDLVDPRPSDQVVEGTPVTVIFGRQLTLNLDGRQRRTWVTALNVGEALDTLRVDQSAFTSISRSMPLGRDGLAMEVRTPHELHFLADGQRVTHTTTAPTVRQALAETNIQMGAKDFTNPAMDSYPADGATISVIRVVGDLVKEEESVPFETEQVRDPAMFVGEKKIERPGVPGVKIVTYDSYTNAEQVRTRKKLAEQIVKPAIPQLVRVGSKPNPTSVPGADDLNWAALARCESGGNPRAMNPSGRYQGLYQFSVPTWRAVGGSGRPVDHSASEQTFRAKKLYKRSGAGQWPVCGRKLFS